MDSPLRSIAVIDDDPRVLESLENLLRSCGYMAQTYLSAELFLASEGLSRNNCIITDLEMRQMTGRNFSSASEAAAAILRSSS